MDFDMCTMELMNDRLAELLRGYRVDFSTAEIVGTGDALCAAYRSSDGEHCFLGAFSREERLGELVDLHVSKRVDGLTDVVRDHLKARGVAYSRALVTRHMPTSVASGGYGLVVEVGDNRDLVAEWYFLPSNMQAIWALRNWRAPGAAAQPAATAPAPKVELGQRWLQPVLTPELRAEIVQEELDRPPEGATAEAWRLVVLETAEPSDDYHIFHARALIRALCYARIGIERYERARQRLLRYGK